MSKKRSIELKSIRLYPTKETLDVWICSDYMKLAKAFTKRYGASMEYYKDELNEPTSGASVRRINSTIKSEAEGKSIIVMILWQFKLTYVVHEIIHVLAFLNTSVGVEFNSNADEWCAYLAEYIYTEIKDLNGYRIYELP